MATLVNRLADDIDIIQATTYDEAIVLATEHPTLELAIVGLSLPESDSLPLVVTLCGLLPQTPVIFVSSSENPETALKAIECGASGFVYKSQKVALLREAVLLAMNGKLLTQPLAQGSVPEALLATPRQRDILNLLAKGKSNKEIARILGVSTHTIKNHLSKIYKRWGLNNRTQAVMKASEVTDAD